MSNRSAREQKLAELFDVVTDGFIERLQSEDATSKDYEGASKFLKDNAIDVTHLDRDVEKPKSKLPFALKRDEEDVA